MGAEKKRLSVTAADLVIVIILYLFGFFTYENVFIGPSEETYAVEYVVKVSAIRAELSDRISVGDDVYSADGSYMGSVTAYERRDAVLGTTGQTLPGVSDLYITIGAQADENGFVSGYEIYAERELELYTTGLSFDCVCIRVR